MRKDIIPTAERKPDLSANPTAHVIRERTDNKISVRLNEKTTVLISKEKLTPEYLNQVKNRLNINL